MRARAAELHARSGRTAGNGSLMRTGPVALAHLGELRVLGQEPVTRVDGRGTRAQRDLDYLLAAQVALGGRRRPE